MILLVLSVHHKLHDDGLVGGSGLRRERGWPGHLCLVTGIE